ncbi:MAG: UDP-3-O-[3-hydroxymyristoyl] N-acetylglucosamine deacetylase [Alphaproteobacteria bacterium]|nr:UDP-3-O-[3-hydroxymyristoyl] N-acetylglucosamine deacetylase [Alphaproteobacteria bacterium]
MFEQTLQKSFSLEGIGLHSGKSVSMEIFPRENGGIIFSRSDIPCAPLILARYDSVVDTTMSTCIGTSEKNRVSTIEHLMGAFYLAGVDHALVVLNSEEIPIGDGSAKQFLEKINEVGLYRLTTKRKVLKILKEVTFENEKASVLIKPAVSFIIQQEIDFPEKLIGKQVCRFDIHSDSIQTDVSSARTFGNIADHEKLKAMGLARGASLDNLLVYNDSKVLSSEGLRFDNEWVRHKVLDTIGDLSTCGMRIAGEYVSKKGGHFHNNQLLKAIFSDRQAFEIIEES